MTSAAKCTEPPPSVIAISSDVSRGLLFCGLSAQESVI